jgi:hypothetical protein
MTVTQPAPCGYLFKLSAIFPIFTAALWLAGCVSNKTLPLRDDQLTQAQIGSRADYEQEGQQERDRAALMMILTASGHH